MDKHICKKDRRMHNKFHRFDKASTGKNLYFAREYYNFDQYNLLSKRQKKNIEWKYCVKIAFEVEAYLLDKYMHMKDLCFDWLVIHTFLRSNRDSVCMGHFSGLQYYMFVR